jgi:hypothetical protein
MSEKNVAVVRALAPPSGLELVQFVHDDVAWAARAELAAPFTDPDVEIRIGVGMGEATRTYVGPEGLRAAFIDWLSPFEEYYVAEVEAFDCGERVLRLTEHTGRPRGSASTVTLHAAEINTFRDGQIVSFESYPDQAEARRTVGLEE